MRVFEISVWNDSGDVVATLWRATEAEYMKVLSEYEDDPCFSVIVNREWEVDDDQ